MLIVKAFAGAILKAVAARKAVALARAVKILVFVRFVPSESLGRNP
jgi:hypothetical protein